MLEVTAGSETVARATIFQFMYFIMIERSPRTLARADITSRGFLVVTATTFSVVGNETAQLTEHGT